MTRIFTVLACLSVALLCVTMLLGFFTGDYNGVSREFIKEHKRLNQEMKELRAMRPRPQDQIAEVRSLQQTNQQTWEPLNRRALTHIWFGVAAALLAVLVNSIGVTYFIGTGRWIREVVETYGFEPQWVARGDAIKRRTFPWALGGMLVAVGIIALGAAAHPGTIRQGTENWVTPHLIGAFLGTAFIAFSYYRQSNNIAANYALIEQVVEKVQLVRHEKGLDDDANSPHSQMPTPPAVESGE